MWDNNIERTLAGKKMIAKHSFLLFFSIHNTMQIISTHNLLYLPRNGKKYTVETAKTI